jgi:hypothetical protein
VAEVPFQRLNCLWRFALGGSEVFPMLPICGLPLSSIIALLNNAGSLLSTNTLGSTELTKQTPEPCNALAISHQGSLPKGCDELQILVV